MTKSREGKSNYLSLFSGTIISIAVTLVLILLFAILIRFFNIGQRWIFPVNQIIKVISLIIGSWIILKSKPEKGFLKGMLLGVLYFVLNFVIFSILQGDFNFSFSNLYDLVLTILMGGLIGIIEVNILKK